MKVAIFDFDLTLTNDFASENLMLELDAKKLLKAGYTSFMKNLLKDYSSHTVNYNDGAKLEFEKRAECLEGFSVLEFQRFVENDFHIEKHMNSWVSKLFELLHSNGYLIVVISAALEAFLEVAQGKLGFDSYFGSQIGVSHGNYTNTPELFMNDDQKAKIVKQIIKDCESSIAFGDSTGDIQMLELVNKGFLYQPNNEAIAAIKGKQNISIVNADTIIEKSKVSNFK